MIEPITTPGKTYAVTSPNGCTVTTEDGITLAEIEAGKQGYFVAVSGKVQLSDDSAILTQLFKLAPQQRLALLGVLGGNSSGLPAGYKRVEYLETTGEQYIDTLVTLDDSVDVILNALILDGSYLGNPEQAFRHGREGSLGGNYQNTAAAITFPWSDLDVQYLNLRFGPNSKNGGNSISYASKGYRHTFQNNKRGYFIDGALQHEWPEATWSTPNTFFYMAPGPDFYSNFAVRSAKWFSLVIKKANVEVLQFIPCLDETGAPCMFDLVSRKPFYNQGSGDFTYPTETATYALRRVLPDWGKLTERGLRRLYHAPASWKGELYDYALENGYKPIVETEQPEDGYWSPRWTETEDEIILEWVETEPPTDEFGLPEEPLT